MRKLTFEELENRLYSNNSNLYDLKEIDNDRYQATCRVCGGHPIMTRYDLLCVGSRLMKCAVCHGLQIEEGINDIKSQYPEIAKYYVDDEYIRTHSIGTKKKGLTECPNCHNQRLILPHKIKTRRFSCPVCDDGVSYPNKFSRQLLLQLPIKYYEFEYHPTWIKGMRSFDNYFEYNNNKYILEMDGEQHFVDSEWGSFEKQQENDKYKENLAIQHNIKVIRIDCKDATFEYIKKNIENSEMASIFDLSIVDWNKCDLYATNSLIKEVCDYYNETSKFIQDIADHFKMHRSTIRDYLKRGSKLKWCDYSVYNSKSKIKQFYVYNNQNKLIGFYKSYIECINDLSDKYPHLKITREGIGSVLNKRSKTHQGLIFIPA